MDETTDGGIKDKISCLLVLHTNSHQRAPTTEEALNQMDQRLPDMCSDMVPSFKEINQPLGCKLTT